MSHYQVIALGDSITYGYPFGHRYSWVEFLSQKLGVPICNSGSNGDTMRDLAKRIFTDVVDRSPKYVLLLGGANDIYQQSNQELMQQHFKKIIQILLEYKITPILGLQTPLQNPKLEKLLAPFRAFTKKQAKEHNCPMVNFYDALLNGKKRKKAKAELYEDEAHPSLMGYQLMAEVAYPIVQKVLK